MMYGYTALVTLIAIFVTIYFQVRVGINRGKFKIYPPKTTGNETWERFFRVHANTVEQMVVFLPALWLGAFTGGDKLAAGIGVIWPVGRLLYSKLYIADPKSRTPGMVLTLLPTVALSLLALYYVAIDIWG